MRLIPTPTYEHSYQQLSPMIQRRVDEKLSLLLKNPRYPSLRFRKMEGYENIWEMRVSRNYRITFLQSGEDFYLRNVGTHDILKNP